jgi:RHS repeat-associated protein
VHTDHLNTPRKIAQPSTGTLAWRWDADPFGTAAPNENPGGLGTFVYNLRAPGQYYQAETGLNQNWNRDYDPLGGGRYIESDPLGLRAGVNTYAYVSDNPVRQFDPSGLIKWSGDMQTIGGAEIFGGGVYNFDLKSQCVNGQYMYLHVHASGVGVGGGLPHLDISGGAGHVEFDDGELAFDPSVFNGKFQIFYAAAGVGVTYGQAFIELGSAVSVPGSIKDPSIGVDASVGAFIGRSAVWGVETKPCTCGQN